MRFKLKISTFFIWFLLSLTSFGQSNKPSDYLAIGGTILFDKGSYNLAWTSHPANNYYKQEYLANGDTIEKYKKLILVEVLTGKVMLNAVVAAKVGELNRMKATNPVVNYETLEKDGEVMLDFLISENTPDGKYLNVIERNVYRYKTVVDKKGQSCVLLFGVSERAYGNDIDNFLSNLKDSRYDLLNSVGAFSLPAIQVAK